MNDKELWTKVLLRLEPTINKAHFLTWFQDTAIIENENGAIKIGTPNSFARDWLANRYNLKIKQAFEEQGQQACEIEYEVHSSLNNKEDARGIDIKQIFKNSIKAVRKIAKKNEVNIMPGVSSKMLNPKYLLENYITGNENKLAHAVCEAVAQNPGSLYNPLFIYGGVGLGKTHLLQATGNRILQNYPDKVVVYMTSERFMNEIISAIGRKKTKSFKERYRNVDCLLIDDIQFLANKSSTQEEFFHTFNHLYDNNKQIIISSDKPPRELNGIEERIKSRFQMGMIVDVTMPEYETRIAILKNKCYQHQIMLPTNILEFIAYNVNSSIRELEGVLLQVIARSQIENTLPTIKMVAEVLRKLDSHIELEGYTFQDEQSLSRKTATNIHDVINIVADYFHLTKSDLISNTRKKEIMTPRQICMYLIRKELDKSFELIGSEFGGRSHTTVMHACNKIDNRIQEDSNLVKDISSLKEAMGL